MDFLIVLGGIGIEHFFFILFTFTSQQLCSGLVDEISSEVLKKYLVIINVIFGIVLFTTLGLMISVTIGRYKMSLNPQKMDLIQPPKNLESSRLNLFVLIIIFVNITGHQFYSWRQVKFILIIIYFN